MAELAVIVAKRGQLQEAKRLLETSIGLDSNYFLARLYYAAVLIDIGATREAELQYQEALRIAPRNVFALSVYAEYLSRTGRRLVAEEHFDKARKIDSNDREIDYYYGDHLYRWVGTEAALPYLKKAARRGNEFAKRLLRKICSSPAAESSSPLKDELSNLLTFRQRR